MKTLINSLLASTFLLTFVTFDSLCQLRVMPNGRVGIGTNNPLVPLHVNGIGYYTGITGHTLRLHPANPGVEIGSSTMRIDFWMSGVNYNNLYAKNYYKVSDQSLKINVKPISSPLEKLLSLEAVLYDFTQIHVSVEGDTTITLIPEYGFISQDVRDALTEVEITAEGKDSLLLMDYNMIIPLVVAAIQEQQKYIKQLESSVAHLMVRNAENANIQDSTNLSHEGSILFSASPNPFGSTSVIRFLLGSNVSSAQIKIWDMNGVEKKLFTLSNSSGPNFVNLNSTDLGTSGTYIYALIVNGVIIDAKKLILIE